MGEVESSVPNCDDDVEDEEPGAGRRLGREACFFFGGFLRLLPGCSTGAAVVAVLAGIAPKVIGTDIPGVPAEDVEPKG